MSMAKMSSGRSSRRTGQEVREKKFKITLHSLPSKHADILASAMAVAAYGNNDNRLLHLCEEFDHKDFPNVGVENSDDFKVCRSLSNGKLFVHLFLSWAKQGPLVTPADIINYLMKLAFVYAATQARKNLIMASHEMPYNPQGESSKEVEQFIRNSHKFSIEGFLELYVRIETRKVYYPTSFETKGRMMILSGLTSPTTFLKG